MSVVPELELQLCHSAAALGNGEPSAKKQKSGEPEQSGSPAKRLGSTGGANDLVTPHNPCPQRWGPPHTYSTKSDKIICVMVGLPARGKSYISRRLSQYLSFFYNVPCKLFNVGDYRRKAAGNAFQAADFFDTGSAAVGEPDRASPHLLSPGRS